VSFSTSLMLGTVGIAVKSDFLENDSTQCELKDNVLLPRLSARMGR
jgi:hypothetical protein